MKINTYLNIYKVNLGFALTLLFLCGATVAQDNLQPRFIDKAISMPEWLSIRLAYRARFESLENQFRAGGNSNDQILVQRTNLLTEIKLTNWKFGLEIMDSRQAYSDRCTPLNTGLVNPLDVLQAYMYWGRSGLFGTNSKASLKIGCFTMDVGSRRFVARNRFCNTINAFTGVDAKWSDQDGQMVKAFYTLPAHRRPTEFEKLLDNETEGDDLDVEVKFWGLYYAFPQSTPANWGSNAELFYFSLDEKRYI